VLLFWHEAADLLDLDGRGLLDLRVPGPNEETMNDQQEPKVLRFWTYDEARLAYSYIRSVLHSIREHWLEKQQQRQRARRLANIPGRPGRVVLVELAEAGRAGDVAQDELDSAIEELQVIDVFCIDPVRGQAIIPFMYGDRPAWFHVDLFSEEIHHWRFASDPLELCRPLRQVGGSARA
jgi:hypothetical protein